MENRLTLQFSQAKIIKFFQSLEYTHTHIQSTHSTKQSKQEMKVEWFKVLRTEDYSVVSRRKIDDQEKRPHVRPFMITCKVVSSDRLSHTYVLSSWHGSTCVWSHRLNKYAEGSLLQMVHDSFRWLVWVGCLMYCSWLFFGVLYFVWIDKKAADVRKFNGDRCNQREVRPESIDLVTRVISVIYTKYSPTSV